MRLFEDVDESRLVATFLELVAVDSPTGHEQEIGEVLTDRFGALGCQVERDEIGNVVAVLPGTREGTILISTHMDTAGTDRRIRPIVGADRVIRTDGSTILGADDKSGIASCLELLTLLRSNPDPEHPTIEFVITVGEEGGLVGSTHLDVGRLNASHGFVLDTAGVMGSVTYWAPSAVELTFTFHGRKAHAGVEPEKGINAVKAAAVAVAAMPLGRIDEETVANIGTVEGGEARNIVPARVLLEGEARSHDQAKLDRQLEVMRRACRLAADEVGATVEIAERQSYQTYKIDQDAMPFRQARAAIAELGLDLVPRKSGGATDGNLFNARGIPCVGLPTGMVDEHASTEHIGIDDMVTGCKILVAIATRQSGSQAKEG